MKIVREYINEKFIEDSDPIHDLGIGGKETIKYCINKLFKLDKEKENRCESTWYIRDYSYNWKTHRYDITFFIVFINEKDILRNNLRSYFIELVKESGLSSFLNMGHEIYTIISEIGYAIKPEHIDYFRELNIRM